MNVCKYLENNVIYLDGGMGTQLAQRGLFPGELPERWNLSHPDVVTQIHLDYFNAGCHVVNTNTFGANLLKFEKKELEEVVSAAINNARTAQITSHSAQPKWVALDIGPTGRMLAPFGDLPFEEAISVFAETVKLGVKFGVDLIFIETMNDSLETKAALLAAKENSDLPVFVSNVYGEDGKLMTGADPAAMIAMLEGMGANAIGMNCSLGPKALEPIAREYCSLASVPVIFKPNAGLPQSRDGKTVYDVSPEEFGAEVSELIRAGVRVVGGCCGTTPAHLSALIKKSKDLDPRPLKDKNITWVSSYSRSVRFDKEPILIGERINPTGKKRFQEALRHHDMDYILKEGIAQEEKGVHILDVNVGLPEIDESSMLQNAVFRLQGILDLPLQIDTSDAVAMEAALRIYNGKAMINSVNGKQESMDKVFPLAKKYGGLVVALTLDEKGIPQDAQGRVAIAKRIIKEAKRYGISKKDLIFDPLALTISSDQSSARETLRAVKAIKNDLGCHTLLGVSNISFGLPSREMINGSFFALALSSGLSAAIVNPNSLEMKKAYFSYRAIAGLDENCADYVAFASSISQGSSLELTSDHQMSFDENQTESRLQRAIVKGLKDEASHLTRQLLEGVDPLAVVQDQIIPALDLVGVAYEKKTLYLPQLLMSAEAAKCAFRVIQESMPEGKGARKFNIVLATVKGDIHDIGKNIVGLLLSNYGFQVSDLGKDVAPETIVKETIRLHAPLVGLSALMTTTVPAMEETIRQLRREAPWCKIVVGGAVLNRAYADAIGADRYAKDAMEAVRYAEEIQNKQR